VKSQFALNTARRKDFIMGDCKIKIGGLLVALLFTLLSVGVSRAESTKIGIVDTQKVLQTSKAAEQARASLLADLKEKRALFQKKQEEVKMLEKEIRLESSGLSPEALRGKRERLAQELKDLKRLKEDLEEQIRRKNLELTKKILQEVRDIIVDYQKKKKYTLILEKKTVITADDSIDITDQIIKLYDQRKK